MAITVPTNRKYLTLPCSSTCTKINNRRRLISFTKSIIASRTLLNLFESKSADQQPHCTGKSRSLPLPVLRDAWYLFLVHQDDKCSPNIGSGSILLSGRVCSNAFPVGDKTLLPSFPCHPSSVPSCGSGFLGRVKTLGTVTIKWFDFLLYYECNYVRN